MLMAEFPFLQLGGTKNKGGSTKSLLEEERL